MKRLPIALLVLIFATACPRPPTPPPVEAPLDAGPKLTTPVVGVSDVSIILDESRVTLTPAPHRSTK